MSGSRGMTELDPRRLEPLDGQRGVRVGAGGLVDGGRDRDHLRDDAGLLQVRQQVGIQRVLVAGLVRDHDADLLAVAEAARAEAPAHGGREDGCVIGSRPPEVGRAQIRPVGRRRPLGEHRRVAFLGDAELVTPSNVPSPSRTANTGGLPWVHCLHNARCSSTLVGSKGTIIALIFRPLMPPASLIWFTKRLMAFVCSPYSASDSISYCPSMLRTR